MALSAAVGILDTLPGSCWASVIVSRAGSQLNFGMSKPIYFPPAQTQSSFIETNIL
jgi:hypothetical protein